MGRNGVSLQKIREVLEEDGLLQTSKLALRNVVGGAHLYYLKNIARAREAECAVNDYRMITRVDDPGISRQLITRGYHEKLATRQIHERLQPGMTAVDLGANMGYYAILEARRVGPTGHVYAIEPVPDNYDLLVRNIELNGLQDVVSTVKTAIAGERGTARMTLAKTSSRHSLFDRADETGSIQVPTVTFDDFVDDQGIDPARLDFVRMDLEGFEAVILPSMAATLEKARGLQMELEIHPDYIDAVPGHSYRETIEFLDSVGAHFDWVHSADRNYKKYRIDDLSPREVLARDELRMHSCFECWVTIGGR